MMRDFDEHRLHRRALSVAFKPEPMKSYLQMLNQGIASGISTWLNASPSFLFYPAIKQLTLDLAAVSFLGAEIGPDVEAVKQAFVDMVAACVGRCAVPFRVRRCTAAFRHESSSSIISAARSPPVAKATHKISLRNSARPPLITARF